MHIALPNGARLEIGFRSPGLTATLSPAQKIQLAVELGMSVIEPQYPRDFPESGLAEALRCAADAAGIRIPSMGCELPLTEPDAREAIDGILLRYVEHAGILGTKLMFSRVMPPPEGVTQARAWELLVENARYVADRLGEAGIGWSIEADPPCFVHTLERFEQALSRIDHPNVWPNFDPTNLTVAGSDPLLAIARFGTRIRSGHIKDGFFRGPRPSDHGECPVGTGEVDYVALFRAMLEAGVRANLFIEHCKTADEVRSAARHVEGVIASLRGEPVGV